MFRWQSRQNKGDFETSEDHDLQTPYGESLLWNQVQQEKGPFQRVEIYKHAWLRSTMTQERFNNLTVLNSHKERTAKSPPPPFPNTHSHTYTFELALVHRPPHFWKCSAGRVTCSSCGLELSKKINKLAILFLKSSNSRQSLLFECFSLESGSRLNDSVSLFWISLRTSRCWLAKSFSNRLQSLDNLDNFSSTIIFTASRVSNLLLL